MIKTSETYPVIITNGEFGMHSFNYNIVETEDGYTYESIDFPGEPTRDNIKYALMLEQMDKDEINEMENVVRLSTKKADKNAYAAYLEKKVACDEIITAVLGENFKQLD